MIITVFVSSELIRCLNFIYTFRFMSAEETKHEKEIKSYESDEGVNIHSLTEVINFKFSYLQGKNKFSL